MYTFYILTQHYYPEEICKKKKKAQCEARTRDLEISQVPTGTVKSHTLYRLSQPGRIDIGSGRLFLTYPKSLVEASCKMWKQRNKPFVKQNSGA